MEEVHIQDKAAYLQKNYPFVGVPDLDMRYECIHCQRVIRVGDYKVYRGGDGFEFICCPNAPECDGTVIDWIPAFDPEEN
jgi:hypothetical protein